MRSSSKQKPADASERAAQAAWKSLSLADQRRLAYEVAVTRAGELRRAYPSIVTIGHGFRVVGETRSKKVRQRSRAATRPQSAGRVTPSVCVVLTVAKKWRETSGKRVRTKADRLPGHLLAFWQMKDSLGGESRVLCAVPTDVRCGTLLRDGRPRAVQIRVDDNGPVVDQKGMIAFAVQQPETNTVFGVSCHHVLAMSTRTSPPGSPASSAVTYLRAGPNLNGACIGPLVTDWIGRLSNRSGETSFDAALCRPTDASGLAALRQAVQGVTPQFTIETPDAVPPTCSFVLAGNQTLRGRFVTEHLAFDGIRYFENEIRQPVQPSVLEFRIVGGTSTQGGDSGCAVLSEGGSELVGMHLGGIDGTTTVFVLPIYEILNGNRWSQEGKSLKIALNF